jgi:hypothetical protein
MTMARPEVPIDVDVAMGIGRRDTNQDSTFSVLG